MFIGWSTWVLAVHVKTTLNIWAHVITPAEANEYDPTLGFIGHIHLPKKGITYPDQTKIIAVLADQFGNVRDAVYAVVHR